MVRSARSIADYDALFDPIRAARQAKSGKQLGDPAKAAQVLLRIANADDAPVHLLLGSDALGLVKEKLETFSEEMYAWKDVTCSTDIV
jgi:hypothetical protein